MSSPSFTIFVSSPGDVASERFLSEKVIDRLGNAYRHLCELKPIFWEHEPLTATQSFQEGLISPRDTDIVVCILWSRLGTRLPKRVTGKASLTGTEFEFLEAVDGKKQNGVPDLLVYRKMAKPLIDLSDRQRRVEALNQIEALETFIDRWFHDEEQALIAAFHPFERADEFEEHLEYHLRKLIENRLKRVGISMGGWSPMTPTWTHGEPFRGLNHFDFEHEPIFFGRTKAVGDVVDHLKRQAATDRAFLVVSGMSGCGKSSLVRAGVLPTLSRPGVIEGVGLCRRVVFRPGDGTGDLFDTVVSALLREHALPELAKDGTTAADLAGSLRADPAGIALMVKGAISQAAASLKPASEGGPQPGARLLFVIDQLEELFTLDRIAPDHRRRFAQLVKALACDPLSRTWVIATLRSDFYGPFMAVPEFAELKEGLGHFDLPLPTPTEIGQIIREPALAGGVRFEETIDGDRLDDVLRDQAVHDPSVLPLLEFLLTELYHRRSERGDLTFAEYHALGGVQGALAQRAENTFQALSPEVQQELPAVFRQLVTIGTLSDETPTRRQAGLDTFASVPHRAEFVRAFIDARLFVSDESDHGVAVVRITHESLLTHWERARTWLAADREYLLIKARVEANAVRWTQEGKRGDRLLPAGKPLEEAEQLEVGGFELEPQVMELISESRKRSRRNRRLRRMAFATLCLLLVGISVFAAFAWYQHNKAALLASEKGTLAEFNGRLADENGQLAVDRGKLAESKAALVIKEQEARKAVEAGAARTRGLLGQFYVGEGAKHSEQGDLRGALTFFVAALKADPGDAAHERTYRARVAAHLRSIPPLRFMDKADRAVVGADGKVLLTVTRDDSRCWDLDTAAPIGPPMGAGTVHDVAITGELAVITRVDKGTDTPRSELWAIPDGRPACALMVPPKSMLISARLLPGGKQVLGVVSPRWEYKEKLTTLPMGSRNSVCRFDVATGKPVGACVPLDPTSDGHYAAYEKPIISADGRFVQMQERGHTRVEAGYSTCNVAVWNCATGRLVADVGVRSDRLNVTFSADGGRLLVVNNGTAVVILLDTPDGKLRYTSPWGTPFDDAISSDGKLVCTLEGDTVTVFNTHTGERVGDGFRTSRKVTQVAWSPDGRMLLTVEEDNTIGVWSPRDGRRIAPPIRSRVWIRKVEFSPDGRYIVTIVGDDVRVLDATVLLRDIPPGITPAEKDADLAPERQGWAVRMIDGTPRVCDLQSGRLVSPALLPANEIETGVFSPDGAVAVQLCRDQAARQFVRRTGKPAGEPLLTKGSPTLCATFDPFKHSLVVAYGAPGKSIDTTASVSFDLEDKWWFRVPVGLGYVARTPTATMDAGPVEGRMQVLGVTARNTFEPTTEEPPKKERPGIPLPVVNEEWIRVLTEDRLHECRYAKTEAQIWDRKQRKRQGPILRHEGLIGYAAFSRTGKRLATISAQKTGDGWSARVWDAATGEPCGPSIFLGRFVRDVNFGPDENTLLTASGNLVSVWNVATGKRPFAALSHPAEVVCASASPDGAHLVTGTVKNGLYGEARVWSLANGALVSAPMRHSGHVEWIEFSPAGEWVLIGTKEDARVWEVKTGQPVTPPLQSQNGALRYGVFGDEGRAVFLTDSANAVSSFPLEVSEWSTSDLGQIARILGNHRLETSNDGASFLVEEFPRGKTADWDRLHPLYRKAIVPNERSSWHTLRELECANARDWPAALFHCTKNHPNLRLAAPGVVRRIADYHRHSGHFAEAVLAYSELAKAEPGSPEVLLGRAQCYLQQRRPTPALVDLREVVKLRPDDWRAHFHAGSAHAHAANWERAIESLHLALERGGADDPVVWETLALVHLLDKDISGYRTVCTRLIAHFEHRRRPQTLPMVCALGPASLEQVNAALKMTRKGAVEQPASPTAEIHGMLLTRAGRAKDGLAVFQKRLKSNDKPLTAELALFMAITYQQLGMEQARQYVTTFDAWADRAEIATKESDWRLWARLSLMRREIEKNKKLK